MELGKDVLIIDLGSSAIRLALLNDKAHCVWISSRSYQIPLAKGIYFEYDAEEWINLLDDLMEEAKLWVKNLSSIASVIITSQRSSVIPVNKAGLALQNAIGWQDRRHAELSKSLDESIPQLKEISGAKMNLAYSGPKMAWLMQNEAGIYEASFKLFNPQEFLSYRLTGEAVTDYTYASRTHLFDVKKLEWSDELIDAFGLDKSKLSKVVAPGSVIGNIKAEWTNKWDLPADLPLITAGADQQCTAVALGVIREGSYQVKIDKGSYIAGISKKVLVENSRFDCNVAAIPRHYNYEIGLDIAENGFKYLANLLFPEKKDYQLEEALRAAPVASNGVRIRPNFYHDDSTASSGSLMDILNLTAEAKAEDILRAFVEALACEITSQIQYLSSLTSIADRLLVEGSLSQYDSIIEILVNTLNAQVIKPSDFESAIYGAWINVAVINNLYKSYEDALGAVHNQIQTKAFDLQGASKDFGAYRDLMSSYLETKKNYI